MKSIDITGIRFGRLLALNRNGFDQAPSRKHIRWDCQCDCGKIINTRLNSLRNGHVRSCGCLLSEGNNVKHGMSKSKEYQTWIRIKERCGKITHPDYYLYGARGIIVCDRWLNSFDNFLLDMGFRPEGKSSLDRIDNNGNYDPSNCRWADIYTQARNKRCNIFYEFNGKNMCLSDWANKLGINPSSLRERLTKWSLEKSLSIHKKEN